MSQELTQIEHLLNHLLATFLREVTRTMKTQEENFYTVLTKEKRNTKDTTIL